MTDFTQLWVYLAREPLAALAATLLAWMAGVRVSILFRRHPAANPIIFSIAIMALALLATGVDYRAYFNGAQFVHFLLGPATVALAIPLYRQWGLVRAAGVAAILSVLAGGTVAVLVGIAFGLLFHASPEVIASLAPRSVTTPVAMGIAEQIGGLPGLAATVVLASGVTGAMLGPIVLNLVRVRDWRARGLAIGTASHGLGTARAISVNATAGAFSGLAMGLNALATALLLPLLWHLFLS